MIRGMLILALGLLLGACGTKTSLVTMEVDTMRVPAERVARFEKEVYRAIAKVEKEHQATIGISIKDDSIDYNYRGDRLFHAASTMKVPVMIAVFRLADIGFLSLDDQITITKTFNSMVDGSPFNVEPGQFVAQRVGETASIRELVREMIQISDNVATNLLLNRITPAYVTRTMRELGSQDGYVIRGLQDELAFKYDISNRITPRDLTNLAEAIQLNKAASSLACAEMREILGGQQHRSLIPALLPLGTQVFNKTGSITGNRHDTGIVSTHVGNYYITIMSESNIEGQSVPVEALADLSLKIYTEWTFLRE